MALSDILFPNITERKEQTSKSEEYLQKAEGLIPQYQELFDTWMSKVQAGYEGAPKLDLTEFKDALSALGEDTTGRVRGYLSETGKYLDEGEARVSSMLDEIMKGSEDYLGGYKRLAQSEMPGLDIYRDRADANLSSGIQTLKSVGGGSPNAIAAMLEGRNRTLGDIAVQAGQYRTQAQQNLADAYLTAGTARSQAYSQAADFSQQAAGTMQRSAQTELGLGQFESGIVGQQAGMGMSEFEYNEFQPWQSEMAFNQAMAMKYNPLDYMGEFYGAATGYHADKAAEAAQRTQANKQTFVDLLGTVGSLIALA